MSLSRNITATTEIANGTQVKFYGIGLHTADPAYSIITIDNKKVIFNTDYTIDTDYGIVFKSAPLQNSIVTIYCLDTDSSNNNITRRDNITTISRTSYVSDGVTTTYKIQGKNILDTNCIVVLNGRMYDKSIYYIQEDNLMLYKPLPRGIVIQVFAFTESKQKMIGGVTQTDNTSIITTISITSNGGIIYNIGNINSNNKSTYCLVFVDGLLYEGGIDYIVSHTRVKFIKIPPANSKLEFVIFKKPLQDTSSIQRVRYLDKQRNTGERYLFNNYWKEQILHYGTIINYYTNLSTPTNADKIYGESPVAGFSEPEELEMIIKLDTESSMYTKFGFVSDTDATGYIHHEHFQEVFGSNSEPKIGDLIELTELDIDRLNFPKRGPRMMEITDKLDKVPGETNALAGHYVWYVKMKRFDYSKEPTIVPELGTKNDIESGADGEIIKELSKQVFNYDANTCSNDNIYGEY